MGFSIIKRDILPDGRIVEVKEHFSMFVASVYVWGGYSWSYEAESYQSVMVWVNKVLETPLPYHRYECGTFLLPHNNGFGNPDGVRRTYTEDLLSQEEKRNS